jgi:metal-dependent hydrolase (beta-lactamase superfamily II)
LTGPVPRPNVEKNWFPRLSLLTAQGRLEDNVPEDSALVFDTSEGIVIQTGCGRAGIVNIVEYARTIVGWRVLFARRPQNAVTIFVVRPRSSFRTDYTAGE